MNLLAKYWGLFSPVMELNEGMVGLSGRIISPEGEIFGDQIWE
jgi:hypothetical protein